MGTKHLDLGCGKTPRNPYRQSELYGVDIAPMASAQAARFKTANLSLEPIPFEESMFDSVSAFDFLEHVPRQVHFSDGTRSRLPFVELMNEVWRVLRPDGVFYALTPVFPHPSVFVDPTHVNFITDKTHEYFCGAKPLAQMYGFRWQFELINCERALPKDAMDSSQSIKKSVRKWHRRLFKPSALSHLVWELRATK